MKKIFEIISNSIYTIASLLLALLSIMIIGFSIYNLGLIISKGMFSPQNGILEILQSVGSIVIAVAIMDVGKYMAEEEVIKNKELRRPQEARETLTKIMVIIAISVSIEGLIYIFKAGAEDIRLLIYPAILILSSVCIVVGLGVYQKLSKSIEEDFSKGF